mmetsp:Transcript_25335/g.65849  ORF Transcript_25335/g.65849 Transcript_25335/m.65849 type:complete len:207 (-) Transcript_25335:337-957(-)
MWHASELSAGSRPSTGSGRDAQSCDRWPQCTARRRVPSARPQRHAAVAPRPISISSPRRTRSGRAPPAARRSLRRRQSPRERCDEPRRSTPCRTKPPLYPSAAAASASCPRANRAASAPRSRRGRYPRPAIVSRPRRPRPDAALKPASRPRARRRRRAPGPRVDASPARGAPLLATRRPPTRRRPSHARDPKSHNEHCRSPHQATP